MFALLGFLLSTGGFGCGTPLTQHVPTATYSQVRAKLDEVEKKTDDQLIHAAQLAVKRGRVAASPPAAKSLPPIHCKYCTEKQRGPCCQVSPKAKPLREAPIISWEK